MVAVASIYTCMIHSERFGVQQQGVMKHASHMANEQNLLQYPNIVVLYVPKPETESPLKIIKSTVYDCIH